MMAEITLMFHGSENDLNDLLRDIRYSLIEHEYGYHISCGVKAR
jgi:hypothetical protein